MNDIIEQCKEIFKKIDDILFMDEKINCINEIKLLLKEYSPFKNEPVDCVLWIKSDSVHANDYNPNNVAPPEMELLKISIDNDGYTQPIVSYKTDNKFEIVDGFHRNRVGREYKDIKKKIFGYLPLVTIKKSQEDKSDRIASTIRHNRARGKHGIDAMSEIVLELKNRNWKDERICKELGMDMDEVLRLCQITGLTELFTDQEFSKAWDIEEASELEEQISSNLLLVDENDIDENNTNVRTVNTNDKNRIFHTYDKWECYKSGFYKKTFDGKTKKECEEEYHKFLTDEKRFEKALNGVITEWKHSCEHYLTNIALNRIAWLGQASMCYDTGIPSEFRSGFNLLTEDEQNIANNIALKYLNIWLKNNDMNEVTLDEAMTNRQSVLY